MGQDLLEEHVVGLASKRDLADKQEIECAAEGVEVIACIGLPRVLPPFRDDEVTSAQQLARSGHLVSPRLVRGQSR